MKSPSFEYIVAQRVTFYNREPLVIIPQGANYEEIILGTIVNSIKTVIQYWNIR